METLIIVVLSVCLGLCFIALLVTVRRASKESVGTEILHIALVDTILELDNEQLNNFMNSLSERTELARYPVASHKAISHAKNCYLSIAHRVFEGRLT